MGTFAVFHAFYTTTNYGQTGQARDKGRSLYPRPDGRSFTLGYKKSRISSDMRQLEWKFQLGLFALKLHHRDALSKWRKNQSIEKSKRVVEEGAVRTCQIAAKKSSKKKNSSNAHELEVGFENRVHLSLQ